MLVFIDKKYLHFNLKKKSYLFGFKLVQMNLNDFNFSKNQINFEA